MTEPDTPRTRGLALENAAILLLAALLVGFVVGHAAGRRQGMTVKQVVIPSEAMAGDPAAAEAPVAHDHDGDGMPDHPEGEHDAMGETMGPDEMMAATAPKAPESLDEAMAMVEMMGQMPAESLVDLGDRKYGNDVFFLSIAFYEGALRQDADAVPTESLFNLAAAYRAVNEPARARATLERVLARADSGADADRARELLADIAG